MRPLSFVGFFVYFNTVYFKHTHSTTSVNIVREGASSDIKTKRSCLRFSTSFHVRCTHSVCTHPETFLLRNQRHHRGDDSSTSKRVLECIKYFFLSFSSYRQCVQISHNKQQFFLFVGYTFCEIYNII